MPVRGIREPAFFFAKIIFLTNFLTKISCGICLVLMQLLRRQSTIGESKKHKYFRASVIEALCCPKYSLQAFPAQTGTESD